MTDPVLARKIAQAGKAPPGHARPVLRALRRGLAQAAMSFSGLPMAVIGATETSIPQDGLLPLLKEDRLMLLLCDGDGRSAAVCVDRAAAGAVMRHQTMGMVTGASADDRPYTLTDAALVAPLAEAILSRACDLLDAGDDRVTLAGFRYVRRIARRRELTLALGCDTYRVCDLVADIGNGVCQGQFCIVLPEQPPEPQCAAGPDDETAEGMERMFGAMRVDLTAILARLRMPLAALSGMVPGDLLPLEGCRLDDTQLITIDGQTVIPGRLGQCRGFRALRVNEMLPEPIDELSEGADFKDLDAPCSERDLPGAPQAPALTGADVIDAIPADMDEAAAEISSLAGLRGGTTGTINNDG